MPPINATDKRRLARLYYTPGGSAAFSSAVALANAAHLPLKTVQTWLQSQPTYTLHRPARKRYPTRRYRTMGLDHQWQADLVEMQPWANKNANNRYILTVVDILSRYAFARPLKNKTPVEVKNALQSIFNEERRKPLLLQTDQGKEFENGLIRSFLQIEGVEQFSVKSPFKASIVERFNRTLKEKMWRYLNYKNTEKWIDVLQKLIQGYNCSVHRVIGRTPASVNKENAMEVWQHLYGNHETDKRHQKTLHVGDQVRISKVKRMFEKGYMPKWTEEIFVIVDVNTKYKPFMYTLRDSSGHKVEGRFYQDELQKVIKTDNVYRIEHVLKERGKGRHKQYLVKWMGYPETSWISASDIVKRRRK
jgi:hypothetical protein